MFIPDTISFDRFEYPYQLPIAMQKIIEQSSRNLITGIGLNNSLFNIEYKLNINDNTAHIIEINSRLSSQFAVLIESVTGQNPLTSICDISVGAQPSFQDDWSSTPYNYCTSFVSRVFENKYITKIPLATEIDALQHRYPSAQIHNLIEKPNAYLSDYEQDNDTYRYAIINVAGATLEEVNVIHTQVHTELDALYEFQPAKQ